MVDATLREDGRVALDSINRLEFVRRLLNHPDNVFIWPEPPSDIARRVCADEFAAICAAYEHHAVNGYIAWIWQAFRHFATSREDVLPIAEQILMFVNQAKAGLPLPD